MSSPSALLGRDTMGTWLRANPAKGKKNVKDTDSAHHAAKRRMEHDGHKRRKMTEKVVLFPIARPRQIQEQRAHLEREDHQQRSEERRVGKECRSRWSPY